MTGDEIIHAARMCVDTEGDDDLNKFWRNVLTDRKRSDLERLRAKKEFYKRLRRLVRGVVRCR